MVAAGKATSKTVVKHVVAAVNPTDVNESRGIRRARNGI